MDKRQDDITFVRSHYDLIGSATDNRIYRACDLSFTFCIRLPQYLYDVANKSATKVSTSKSIGGTGTAGGGAGSAGTSLATAFLAVASTPTSAAGTTATTGSSTSVSSPAMELFLASLSKSTTDKNGYCGGVDFLDDQNKFNITFGDLPTLLPARPNDSHMHSFRNHLKEYIDKCKFDIFMHLCKLGYLGHEKVDKSLNIHEVCRQIGTIKNFWSKAGKVYNDTPDELYDTFTSIPVGLPNNATTRSVNLCSSYLSALKSELSETVTSDSTFTMLKLTNLTTESLQLEALRYVRHQVSESYRELCKHEKKMSNLLESLNTT